MEAKSHQKSLRLPEGALFLLFASVLLPSNAKSIAIGLFAVVSILHFFKSKNTFNFRFFIVNGLVYIVVASTLLYSDNFEFGIKKLTIFLSLILFPLCFAMYSREDIKRLHTHLERYFAVYIVTVALFNVISFLWFYITHYSFDEMLMHFPMIMKIHVGKYKIHPIYSGMHCSAALLFSIYIFRSLKSRWKIVGLLIINLVLVLFLLLYAKKGSIIALMVVSFVFVLFQHNKGLVKPYAFLIVGLLVLMITIPRTRDKFLEFKNIESITQGAPTSTNIRFTIYGIALDVIRESPIAGYGVGDYREVLTERYELLETKLLEEGGYNAHNQFLSFLLIGGLIALLAFLATLVLNFIFAVRFNNELLILVIIFYSIMMLTDNIFEKESGVIYFSLFFNFLSAKTLFATPIND
ncbi:O-antigen ligase [uncultured Dokdonia sp.]|uniref:O-antigen ligase family protein n=1 Tax=unclassified Dokdonia TaxID=2615033 RepID=UPI0026243C3C|nr:O-antigen ligase family protein [uncultured Dokdonia sp.]